MKSSPTHDQSSRSRLKLVPPIEASATVVPFTARSSASAGERMQQTVEQAARAYIAARSGQLARTSLVEVRSQLFVFVAIVGASLPIERVTLRHIDKWARARDRAPSTVVHQFSVLRVWFQWLTDREWITKNPTTGWTPPSKPRLDPRELGDDEVRALFAVLRDTRARVAVALMVNEGLRVAEVTALRPDSIDRVRQVVHIVGKGGHERTVVISPDTRAMLAAYLAENPRPAGVPLLASFHAPYRGITPAYLSRCVVGWMRAAGIKDVARDGKSAHALRHTAAGRWLDQGADPRDVQMALGHASLSSTWVYLRRRVAVDRMRPYVEGHSYLYPEREEPGPEGPGEEEEAV